MAQQSNGRQMTLTVDGVSRARERLGLDRLDRARPLLDWYVRFIQQDLEKLSPGEWLTLQEDLTALEHEIGQVWSPKEVGLTYEIARDPKWIHELQQYLGPRLEGLADRKEGPDFGTFTIHVTLTSVSTLEGWKRGRRGPAYLVFRDLLGDTEKVPMPDGREQDRPSTSAFLFHIAHLLENVQQEIRRCPRSRCNRLFFQFRRHAAYCSRTCQSIAATEAIRKRQREETMKRSKARQREKSGKRKEPRHG